MDRTMRFDDFDRDTDGRLIVDPESAAAQRQAAQSSAPEVVSLADLLPPAPPTRQIPRDVRGARAWLLLVLAGVGLLIVVGLLLRTPSAHVRHDDQPTPIPATEYSASEAVTAVQPTYVSTLSHAVVARWDYRDAGTSTALDAGTAYTLTGQADGGAWLLITLDSGRAIWVPGAAVDVDSSATLPDYTPKPTPVPAPVYVAPPAPPLVCGEYGVPGKMIQACGATQAEADTTGEQLWKQTYVGGGE